MKRKKILVIDDDEKILKLIERFLSQHDLDVITASNGEIGLLRFQNQAPDLVIVDLLLPGVMGYQVLTIIRESKTARSKIPVIFISDTSKVIRDHYLTLTSYKADAIFAKPFHVKMLIETVKTLLTNTAEESAPPPVVSKPSDGVIAIDTPISGSEGISDERAEFPGAHRNPLVESLQLKSPDELIILDYERSGIYSKFELRGVFGPSRLESRQEELPVDMYGDVLVSQLFFNLFRDRFTGKLELLKNPLKKVIYFLEGHPVSAVSNLKTEALGEWLLAREKITKEQHQDCLNYIVEHKCRYGEALLGKSILNPSELYQALQTQTVDRILEVFSWGSGEYQLSYDSGIIDEVNVFDINGIYIIFRGILERYFADNLVFEFGDHFQDYLHQSMFFSKGEPIVSELNPVALFLKPYLPEKKIITLFEESGLDLLNFMRCLKAFEVTEMMTLSNSPQAAQDVPTESTIVEDSGEKDRWEASMPIESEARDKSSFENDILREFLEMKVADFFGVLRVSPQATQQEIRNAYVLQKNRWNPETYTGKVDDKVLRKISVIHQKIIAAFTVLSDESSRARYLKHIEDSSKEALSQIVKAEMYFLRGEKDLKNKEYVQAKEHFEMARKLNPKEPEYLLHVGWLTFMAKPDDIIAMRDSLKIIKEALTLNPRMVKGFIYLAILARKANHLNYAMKYLKKALTIEPENRQAQMELAELKSLFQKTAGKENP